MISQEFSAAVKEKNLLRIRIMLKDSLLVDLTFSLFDKRLQFVEEKGLNVIEEFRGEPLEDDKTKWTKDLMNFELVQLVGNFSEERIEHLKKMIHFLLGGENQIEKSYSGENRTQRTSSTGGTSYRNSYAGKAEAMETIIDKGRDIGRIVASSFPLIEKKLTTDEIHRLENLANELLESIRSLSMSK